MNTVLIIDDSDINLTLIRALVLKQGDCETVLFANPLKAVEWCRDHVPDLVIVDYMMPDMDGLQFISAFRAMHGRNEIPVLMITANDQKDVRYDALMGGANDFLKSLLTGPSLAPVCATCFRCALAKSFSPTAPSIWRLWSKSGHPKFVIARRN